MKIVSIDPGTRNCGYAVWNNGNLTDFGSYDLFELVPKSKKTDYPLMAKAFVQKSGIFENVDVVLIENQMQARMKMLACAWRCFFWGKSVAVSPLSVRKFFKISNGDYKKNKSDSKIFVGKFLNKSQLKKLMTHKKRDDVADAVIQLFWYLKKNKL
jgi:hypothetical protein